MEKRRHDADWTGIRLQAEYEQYRDEMAKLRPIIDQAREQLFEISQPHFEVLEQWDAYVADHNAELPDIERVRDLESTRYRELYYGVVNTFRVYPPRRSYKYLSIN